MIHLIYSKYERICEYNVSDLEPIDVGYKPDQVKIVREIAGTRVNQIYISSCINGRIEERKISGIKL